MREKKGERRKVREERVFVSIGIPLRRHFPDALTGRRLRSARARKNCLSMSYIHVLPVYETKSQTDTDTQIDRHRHAEKQTLTDR